LGGRGKAEISRTGESEGRSVLSNLKAFVAVSGKTRAPIGHALVFRQRVAAEFERWLGVVEFTAD
jgi:hypothetical protein